MFLVSIDCRIRSAKYWVVVRTKVVSGEFIVQYIVSRINKKLLRCYRPSEEIVLYSANFI